MEKIFDREIVEGQKVEYHEPLVKDIVQVVPVIEIEEDGEVIQDHGRHQAVIKTIGEHPMSGFFQVGFFGQYLQRDHDGTISLDTQEESRGLFHIGR